MATPDLPGEGLPPVPLLDVRRQNAPLRVAIDSAVSEVCESGAFIHGPACLRLEEAIAAYCGTQHAIGCASGSDALLLALMALGVGAGDEVILPSFTFFATAGSVWRLGGKPVFADIDPETFNIDPADVARKVTPATRAIMPVHLFGQCAAMGPLQDVADAYGLPLIEDAAQAIGATHSGRSAGSLGNLGCFSFYPTKNLGAFGDGGMITTNDGELAARLRILRDHGQSPRYHHHLVGVNSRLDAIQAAVLAVKLPHLNKWTLRRRQNALRYESALQSAQAAGRIELPSSQPADEHVWNQFTIRVRDNHRDSLKSWLDQRQCGSAIYYPVPLHLQPCFAALDYAAGSLPETERAAQEVLSLPVFPELTSSEQDRVVAEIDTYFASVKRAAA